MRSIGSAVDIGMLTVNPLESEILNKTQKYISKVAMVDHLISSKLERSMQLCREIDAKVTLETPYQCHN